MKVKVVVKNVMFCRIQLFLGIWRTKNFKNFIIQNDPFFISSDNKNLYSLPTNSNSVLLTSMNFWPLKTSIKFCFWLAFVVHPWFRTGNPFHFMGLVQELLIRWFWLPYGISNAGSSGIILCR